MTRQASFRSSKVLSLSGIADRCTSGLTPPMRCPTLAELPPPPAGKTGWPWTIETPALPASRADGSPWPRISIVTPSYNQGQFIEETIRSVLLQGYPDLEYIVIDGGSTDQSVEIIRKYERWLTYWVSEKDRGQAHAINKGFSSVTGELFNWINSDDLSYRSACGGWRRQQVRVMRWLGTLSISGLEIPRLSEIMRCPLPIWYWETRTLLFSSPDSG